MPDDASIPLQLVLLIAELERAGVMDQVRHPLGIAPIGDDAHMAAVQHDVAAAPLGDVARVRRKTLRMRAEKDLEVGRSAKIDRRVGGVDRVGIRTHHDVCGHERLKVVARRPTCRGDHIGADAELVIGITRGVIGALIVRAGLRVREGGGKDVVVVVDAVSVAIRADRSFCPVFLGLGPGPLRLAPALSRRHLTVS